MFQYIPTGINFKIFVKETNSETTPNEVDAVKKYLPLGGLTGEKAKEFYEEVLKDSSLSCGKRNRILKPNQRRVAPTPGKPVAQSKTFKSTDLLRMAQNNDVKSMSVFFAQNKNHDVNIVDEFGWTPLMCASCSGAERAVELLLQNGADVDKRDKLGETALSLARRENQKRIAQILEDFKILKPEAADEARVAEEAPGGSFFCPACKGNFPTTKNKHETSTVHLFNCRIKTSTYYGIPESNRGFQLLLREGWDKEKGLGRDGTGRKFPIKAVMKKDRTGIGAIPSTDSSKRESRQTENKRAKLYKSWKEKDFEKNFRLEFS